MATYKVIQDIEAEDKLVGPLTLRQFIYAGVSAVCLYICFLLISRGASFMIVFFLPIALVSGFFAFPWKGEQPTEIWALARIRFAIKPRVRIWDQDGVKDLVQVLAPKKLPVRRSYKDNMSEYEVRSRLKALANTIDSRGWATRNAAYGMYPQNWTHPTVAPVPMQDNALSALMPSGDMFDGQSIVAQNFDAMLAKSTEQKRQRVIQQMNNAQNPYAQAPTPAPIQPVAPMPQPAPAYQYQAQAPSLPAPVMPGTQSDYWFANGPAYPAATAATQPPAVPAPVTQPVVPQVPATPPFMPPSPSMPGPMLPSLPPMPAAGTRIESDAPLAAAATPSTEEVQTAEQIRQQNASMNVNYNHMRVLQPAGAQPLQPAYPADQRASDLGLPAPVEAVTADPNPAILELANNDDLDIATLARQAKDMSRIKDSPDEVEIRLH